MPTIPAGPSRRAVGQLRVRRARSAHAGASPFGGTGGGNADTTHDDQDHLVKVTDANGTVTGYVFSDRDLLTREVSEVTGATNSTYNEHGQLTAQIDARGIPDDPGGGRARPGRERSTCRARRSTPSSPMTTRWCRSRKAD